MASKTHSDKIISDVEDCIAELWKEFSTYKTPINDDSISLHRFEEKLEYVLQHRMKEKLSILGAKKSYWDYICVSFSSSKRTHDGLKYVKSMSELKTSLGRGRAFIRFCLMHKCLADTLQSCFTNHKSTSEYYFEKSVPVQKKLSSALIASLYDLNEVNFDLTSRYADLDISWPTFARKLFVTSEDLNVPSRNHSISSFQSLSSQNDSDVPLTFASDSSAVREQLLVTQENKNNIQSFPNKKMDLNDIAYSGIYEVKSVDSEFECSSSSLNECEKSTQHVCSSSISDSAQIESHIKSLQVENKELLQRISILECLLKEKEINSHYNLTRKSDGETSETSNTFTSQDITDDNQNPQLLLSERAYAASSLQNESEYAKMENCNSPTLNFHKESNNLSIETSNEIFCTRCSEQLLSKSELNNAVLEHDMSSLKMSSQNSSPLIINENPLQFETMKPKSNFDALLQEMKTIIFDFQSILPDSGEQMVTLSFLSRLKNIRKALEINLVENNESLMYDIQNKLNEQYIGYIKSLVMEQDRTIDTLEENVETAMKLNENLYSKICTLRDLLHSYGLLKFSSVNNFVPKMKSASETKRSCAINADISSENVCFDIVTSETILNSDIMPLLSIYMSASSKLKNLNGKVEQLQHGLESSQALNDNLLSRVQDQELRLKGVTKELEEAQVLVSVLKGQHEKLQSAEGILKYDLQEKRKLLTRLRNQLESTREDWKRVRQKNSKSEAEWQDLRKEFVLRHKQASEESGFIDDKGLEEQTSISKIDDISETVITESIAESSESANTTVEIKEKQEVSEKKTRLEIMEEQCRLLYSSLLRGSQKRQELDNRLESLCRGIERPPSENKNPDKNIAVALSAISSSEDVSHTLPECAVTEDMLDDREHSDSISFVNDLQVLSEVGSLNSNCSISPNIFSSETNLLDTDCAEISIADHSLSCNMSYCNVEKESTGEIQLDVSKHLNLASDVSMSLSDSAHETMCISDYEDFHQGLISDSSTSRSSSVEPYKNEYFDNESKTINLTRVDSLLIKKKDLEKCIEHYEIPQKNDSNENTRLCKDSNFFQERKEFVQKMSALKDENELLQQQVLELENKVLIIEAQLNQTSRQLVLSKMAKDQEVAAVQFQLSTEALKYEKALQQFTEQNIGLEDMKQKVSDQEQLIFALEEALTEIRLERECEKEHQWQELEEIQFALMAREEECLTLSENLEKLQEVKVFNQQDRDSMEAELYRLRSDSKELRKKLIRLVKEKDLLWKRTDHLSHLQKVQVADRWMNDHEVSNCLSCKNRFSFILRKHHCRLCGRIFCHSCSNNWLSIAASRHRSRVCNECYMLHMEMEKEARRGSDIPCVEDSEDEAVADDLSINHMSESSFNSEVPQCITNSIISLPARSVDSPKRSPLLFSSAPDLRCVLRQEDETRARPKSMIHENLDEEDDRHENHDVISNEENTKSLSVSYNTAQFQRTDEKTVLEISTRLTCTTTEIEDAKDGITGELSINAGMIYGIPITCENPPTELRWSFICDSKPATISLWYKEKDLSSEQLILCSSEHKMDDKVKLSLPGFYVIHINNSSRSAQKVAFTLKVKRLPELSASS